MPTLASLNVKLGAETSQFNRKMSAARNTIRSMTGAVIGLAGSVGFAALTKSTLDAADKIQKLRDGTGLSTEFLSAFRFVASQTGTDLETVTKSVSKMQKVINDAGDGLKAATRAFDALGLPIAALQQLKPEDQFIAILDALSKMEDETKRAAVGQQIFGRNFVALGQLSRLGASGIQDLVTQAEKANQVLGDDQVDAAAAANDAIDALSRTWSGIAQQAILNYADELRGVVLVIGDVLPRAIENLKRGFRSLGILIGGGVASLVQLSRFNFKGALQIQRESIADAGSAFRGEPLRGAGQNDADRKLIALQQEGNTINARMLALMQGGALAVPP